MNTITVPFHGNALYLINYNDEPYTPMKPIVEGMGMNWASQYTKLKQRFSKGIVQITIPSAGGTQEMTCLVLRKLNGWLQTINPNKVKPEIRDKVIQYQEECDDVLYEYWTKGQVINPRKRSVMQELNAACAELKSDKAIASLFGTGLSEWKSIKAAHTKKVKGLIEEAQLLLTF